MSKNPTDEMSLGERDKLIHSLEVKIKAMEIVMLTLLQIQEEDAKEDLRNLADIIQSQFRSERPGISDGVGHYRHEIADALADIIRCGTARGVRGIMFD